MLLNSRWIDFARYLPPSGSWHPPVCSPRCCSESAISLVLAESAAPNFLSSEVEFCHRGSGHPPLESPTWQRCKWWRSPLSSPSWQLPASPGGGGRGVGLGNVPPPPRDPTLKPRDPSVLSSPYPQFGQPPPRLEGRMLRRRFARGGLCAVRWLLPKAWHGKGMLLSPGAPILNGHVPPGGIGPPLGLSGPELATLALLKSAICFHPVESAAHRMPHQ